MTTCWTGLGESSAVRFLTGSSRHVHLHESAWDGSVKVILRRQAVLGSPRGVPGAAWESLCRVAGTCEAVGAGRGSFPPEVRCAMLGDVVASVEEGPASRFRATRAVCSRQPSWGCLSLLSALLM